MDWIEIVGYSGSFLVAISLMMTSMKKLRWINLIGASTFATYGLLLNAYPVFILNGFITLVDLFYIFQMYRKKDYFEILEILNPKAAFLTRFLDFHCDDIKTFFPDVDFKKTKKPLIFFTLRNMLPVGLFIGEIKEDNSLEIKMEYVTQGYRDFKVAEYHYKKNTTIFEKHNVKTILINSTVYAHVKFLKKVGFTKDMALGENNYSLILE
ncbi:MAG: hypothetical protein D8M58_11525 [Calditrichaeota bacterium]|nr:MAG: hypothetical protein DWQ03_10900 [Calditrichota bacterium]MBL1206024.1 hypothetical protein [Calditrichota bacterium]NOG45852.1 hypothetical protein [Calditrichota bacterium]